MLFAELPKANISKKWSMPEFEPRSPDSHPILLTITPMADPLKYLYKNDYETFPKCFYSNESCMKMTVHREV